MGNLSKHFDTSEWSAPDGHEPKKSQISKRLIERLEQIRTGIGDEPIIITEGGGWRPEDTDSLHSQGQAADIHAPAVPLRDLYEHALIVMAGEGGVGIYPLGGFIHIDVRGAALRWVRVNGKYYYW